MSKPDFWDHEPLKYQHKDRWFLDHSIMDSAFKIFEYLYMNVMDMSVDRLRPKSVV